MPTDIYSLTIEPSGELSLTLSDQGVSIPANHAGTHASGSSDPITIANTQVTGLGTMSTQNANNVAITAGTIAGVAISTSTLSSPTINTPVIAGGTINSAVIGGLSPAAGTFTAVVGTTGTFSGAISGTTGTFTGNTSVTGTLLVTGAVTLNTDLTVSNGGTGVSTITGIVKGNGTSAMSAVTSSTVGQVLRCTGTDAFAFGSLDLDVAAAVTGTLPVARGGTGATSESTARIALDVPATNSTIRWRSDITAYTGGTSNALDSIDISNTTTWPTGACIAFSVSGVFVAYRLTATGAGESTPDIIVPDTAYASREWTLIASGADAVVAITGGTITGITDLAVADGGTGVSTITGIVKGNGASAMSAVTSSTVGQVLRCTGTDSFAFGEVNLADTDAVTGILPVARGGTGATSESAARIALDVPATNSTIRWRSDITAYTGGTSNALDSIDISNTTTWPTGACIAFSVSGVFVAYRLTATGAGESTPDIIVPDTAYASREWTLIASGADAVVAITGGTITGITDLAVADGGTGVSTITGIVKGNGASAMSAVTSSTVGQVLRCTGTDSFAFGEVNLADTDAVTGTLPVARGGTGATTLAGVQTAIGIVSGTGTLNGVVGVVVSVPGATSSSNIVACPRAAGSGTSGIVYCVPGTDQITVTSTQATDLNAFTYFGTL